MSELDFDHDEPSDSNLVHKIIRHSSTSHYPLSPGAKTKKRFRLNYGSTKLSCRNEMIDDPDESACMSLHQQISVPTQQIQQELRPRLANTYAQNMTKSIKKSNSRRRKRIDFTEDMDVKKRKMMNDDIFLSYSPDTFTSTPSKSTFYLSSGSIVASNITKEGDDSLNYDTNVEVTIERGNLNDIFESPQSSCAEDQSTNTSTGENNSSGAERSQSPESSHAQSSIISYNNQGVVSTRAGTDVFAAQDAGAFRMVLDDCLYYCSSFFSSFENDRNVNSCSIAADSISDLAVMLSSKKNRSILITFGESEKQPGESVGEPSALQTILKTISHVPNSILGSSLPKSEYKVTSEPISSSQNDEFICIPWSRIFNTDTHAFMKQDDSKSSRLRSMLDNLGSNTAVSDFVISRGLSIIYHYLSSDCFPSRENSIFGNNAAAAKQFKNTLLQAHPTLHGISRLLLDDVVVNSILTSCEIKANSAVHAHDTQGTNEAIPKSKTCSTTLDIGHPYRDPTAMGRNKKKSKRIINMNHFDITTNDQYEDKTNHGLDFRSDDGSSSIDISNLKISSKLRHKLASAEAHIQLRHHYNDAKYQSHHCKHCCAGSDSITKQNPGYLTLDALTRILSNESRGNENESFDSQHSNDFNEPCDLSDREDLNDEFDIEHALNNHPLMYKNRMVQESGSLPFLARSMTEALEASVHLFLANDYCDRCCTYIRDRIQSLATIINDVCLLCNYNRVMLCQFTSDDNVPLLITSLMKLISCMFSHEINCSISTKQMFADIVLTSLRVLTSLTHENNLAGFQICQQYSFSTPLFPYGDYRSGIEITFNLLHYLVYQQESYKNDESAKEYTGAYKSRSQHTFDSIIFCLNTMTNVLETTSSMDMSNILVKMSLPPKGLATHENSENALSWLSSWVVNQTVPFRDAVMDSAPSSEGSCRGLETDEDEFLLSAGNGFVLLACFLRQDSITQIGAPNKLLTLKARELILEKFPLQCEGKLKLAVNTLKAFCNFYRYSIGDLSVAIIEPVLKLIQVLENINE